MFLTLQMKEGRCTPGRCLFLKRFHYGKSGKHIFHNFHFLENDSNKFLKIFDNYGVLKLLVTHHVQFQLDVLV